MGYSCLATIIAFTNVNHKISKECEASEGTTCSMVNRRLGLCIAPLLLFLVDISLTLWGQPADYWTGNYAAAREGSPEVRRVMQIHPALLFAMIAVWMGVIVLLVQLRPRLLAELFSVATVIAHTACAAQWHGIIP